MKVNCPNCKKRVEWKQEFPFRPFCSKRCQLIDLGQWADEENKISDNSIVDKFDSNDPSASNQIVTQQDIEDIEELLNNLSKKDRY